jgi:hypothetical protein
MVEPHINPKKGKKLTPNSQAHGKGTLPSNVDVCILFYFRLDGCVWSGAVVGIVNHQSRLLLLRAAAVVLVLLWWKVLGNIGVFLLHASRPD